MEPSLIHASTHGDRTSVPQSDDWGREGCIRSEIKQNEKASPEEQQARVNHIIKE